MPSPTLRRHLPRTALLLAGIAAVALTGAGWIAAPSREAILVLEDVNAGAAPSRLKGETPAPDRVAVTVPAPLDPSSNATESWQADLYTPGSALRGAMLLVPGLSPAGKDDPRLIAFATTLSRAGFAVLVPQPPDHRVLRVSAQNAALIAGSIDWLHARQPDLPLGVFAVSFAVGPTILALTRPDTGRKVDVVVAAGGYYDIAAAITFFTTGYFHDHESGTQQWRAPDNRGKWHFVAGNLDRLAPPRDRTTLAAMAWRRANDPAADLSDLAATLGPAGHTVYTLLNDPTPAAVPSLLADLPEAARGDLDALDLTRLPLARLTSRFLLLHGRDDPVIPASQSEALAAALPQDRTTLFLLDTFNHLDPHAAGWGDQLRLAALVDAVLARRRN